GRRNGQNQVSPARSLATLELAGAEPSLFPHTPPAPVAGSVGLEASSQRRAGVDDDPYAWRNLAGDAGTTHDATHYQPCNALEGGSLWRRPSTRRRNEVHAAPHDRTHNAPALALWPCVGV